MTVNKLNRDEVGTIRSPSAEWTPLIREAGIAAQSICAGLTALRKADFSRHELYNHAFFGLSIGLERLAKLVILLDDKKSPPFQYPTNTDFKVKYGHDLQKLFDEVEKRRTKYQGQLQWELPNRVIALTALTVLGDFAKGTRYYNLDLLTGAAGVASKRDPIEAWYTDVAIPILKGHYSPRRAQKDAAYAEFVGHLLEGKALVRFTTEDGEHVRSVQDSIMRSKQAEIIQRESAVIGACLTRHMSELLFVITPQMQDVPDLSDFFVTFYNEERMFRSWKVFKVA